MLEDIFIIFENSFCNPFKTEGGLQGTNYKKRILSVVCLKFNVKYIIVVLLRNKRAKCVKTKINRER